MISKGLKAESCIWHSEGICTSICYLGKCEESHVRLTRGAKLRAYGNRPEAPCPPHTLCIPSAHTERQRTKGLALFTTAGRRRAQQKIISHAAEAGESERENHKTIFKQLFSGEAGRHRRRKRFVWKITAKDDSWADSDKLPGNLHLAVLGLCQPIIPHKQQKRTFHFPRPSFSCFITKTHH